MIAIVGKEWRRLLRASSTPWALAAYLLLPLALGGLAVRAGEAQATVLAPQWIAQLGAQVLSAIATGQVLLLAVAAVWVSAGQLAGEVEEETLEPLLAGGVPLLGVVLGKLLAVALFLGLWVLAGLPLFTVAAMLGGVSWQLIGRVVALEMGTALFMAGVGLALSAFGRRTAPVAMAGLAVALLVTLGSSLAVGAVGGVYSEEQRIVLMKMGLSPAISRPIGQVIVAGGGLPAWLYANPLVGLNSALNQAGSSSFFSLPAAGFTPVYKGYRLWQLQAVGGAAAALAAGLLAWAVMALRLGWRAPGWLLRRRRAPARTVGNDGGTGAVGGEAGTGGGAGP